MRRTAWCGLVLLVLGAVGCSSSGNIKGKVYYRDKPLTGGTVLFWNADGKGSKTASIDESGDYTIEKMPTGLAKIAVDSGPGRFPSRPPPKGAIPPKDTPMPEGVDPAKLYTFKAGAHGSVPIPEQYKNYETSQETYTVVSGDQQYDIRLK
jgi:hypothetical protein